MRRLINYLILIVLVLSALLPINVALASNTTLAEYIGTVRITNNGTTATNVFTVFNLTTQDLIDGDFVFQNLTNSSMLTNGGADTEYMPAPGATNAWAVYVPSIIQSGSLDYKLYLGGEQDMESEIRYVAGSGGMTSVDSPTLELVNNFTISQQGFLNTTFLADMNLAFKDQAFLSYISDTDEITSGVWGSTTDFQFHNTGDDGWLIAINAANAGAQTFTPQRRHYITNVRVELQEIVGTTGTLVIALRATDGAGAPTGGDLVFDTIDANTIPGAPGAWFQFDFTPFRLEASTTYAIVAHSDAGNPLTNFVEWRTQAAGTYSGGQAFLPLATPRAWDTMFEEWGFHFADAANVPTADHIITTSITDAPTDIQDYTSDAQIGVSLGNGLIPAMILERQQLTSAAAPVTFSNITAQVALWDTIASVTSRHLVVLVNGASDRAADLDEFGFRFNGDVGANYNLQKILGTNAVASASRSSVTTTPLVGSITAANVANGFGSIVGIIPYAFNTANDKIALVLSGASEMGVVLGVERWDNINAITAIEIFLNAGDFITGSEFILAVVDERYLEEEDILAAPGTMSFAGITQADGNLVTIGYLRSAVGFSDLVEIEINGDAVAANYHNQFLLGAGFAISSASGNNDDIGIVAGAADDANTFGAFLFQVSAYSEGANQPHYLSMSGHHGTATSNDAAVYSGRRANVAAITQLDFTSNGGGNFVSGSMMSLYRVPRFTISRQELAAPAATVTFNNIPQGYEALQLNIYARSDVAALSEDVEITINTDAVAANYDFQELTGTAGVVAATRNAASQVFMVVPAANEGANEFGGGLTTFNQYSTTIGHKNFVTLSGTNENQVIIRSSRWEDTSAITRIDLDLAGANNFIAGSVFALIGWMPSKILAIEVDGDLKGSDDGNISVPDNVNTWTFVENWSMPWLQRHTITIDNVLQQDIDWENDSTLFTDASGQGHDTIPTFRTLTSNPDVTAELISFVPVAPAVASNITILAPDDMIGPVVEPSALFNETVGPIPGAPFIEDVMNSAGIPAIMFYIPLLMLFLCIVGLVVGKFSLLAQLIIMTIIIFASAGIGVPAWIGLIFFLDGLAFVLASKQFGW